MHLSVDLRPFRTMVSHPLNFLIKPKNPGPDADEKLKELTLCDPHRTPDPIMAVHNAWANGLTEVCLNGVDCTIEVVPTRRGDLINLMAPSVSLEVIPDLTMAEIGQRIKETQDHHREEASYHHERAAEIGAAWSLWDVDELLRLGAINERDAEFIRSEKEKA